MCDNFIILLFVFIFLHVRIIMELYNVRKVSSIQLDFATYTRFGGFLRVEVDSLKHILYLLT